MSEPSQNPKSVALPEQIRQAEFKNILAKLKAGKTLTGRESELAFEMANQQEEKNDSYKRPAADSPTTNVETLADLFNMTGVRVQQLAVEGVVIKHARGRYDLWQSIRNYIRYLQERKVNQWTGTEGEQDGYTQHRARLTKAKADKAEVEAALIKGTAHEAQAVAAVWSDMVANTRAKLLALPTKLAAQLEGMTIAERQSAIHTVVLQALTELSEYSPEAITGEYIRTRRHEDEEQDLDIETDE